MDNTHAFDQQIIEYNRNCVRDCLASPEERKNSISPSQALNEHNGHDKKRGVKQRRQAESRADSTSLSMSSMGLFVIERDC